MSERTLLSIEKLPVRELPLDRLQNLNADITEAGYKLKRQLEDRATRLHTTGWVEDPEGVQLAIPPTSRTVVGTLKMTRPDDG